jgi:hypothetical protein
MQRMAVYESALKRFKFIEEYEYELMPAKRLARSRRSQHASRNRDPVEQAKAK